MQKSVEKKAAIMENSAMKKSAATRFAAIAAGSGYKNYLKYLAMQTSV